MNDKRARKPPAVVQDELSKRTKQEWIESAEPVFKKERFEMAGALFDRKDTDLLSEQEVKKKLDTYLNPVKEEANVDSTE
ncbi:hypothetical protein DFP93_103194 [Aneurinibacillus soli]|uniref:YqzN/YkzM domain-containing protein n=1 Tax=Aneurinibacillus soli TaxID=1500254 RepID=A0A0U5B6B8_9BACL|nr:hypothetical protein [Aneurinibacillus soli]PYE62982.1 hypothetical protein DFP93_103194 [Aneurinibacillus soli]BAU28959.1 hypothetical protein CB4_03136 [Aneurinibacillus soli]